MRQLMTKQRKKAKKAVFVFSLRLAPDVAESVRKRAKEQQRSLNAQIQFELISFGLLKESQTTTANSMGGANSYTFKQ